jgi:flagellar assembly protein FliH
MFNAEPALSPARAPRFMTQAPSPRPLHAVQFQRGERPQGQPGEGAGGPGRDKPAAAPEAPSAQAQAEHAKALASLARQEEQLRDERERLREAIELLHVQGERFAEQARADALEIGFQVAHRVVETELRTSPEPLFALVRSALRHAGEARRVKIRVCPGDVEQLRGPRASELTSGLSVAHIEVVADSSLSSGDCMVDTDFGHIDGRLATRFQELKRALSVTGEVA